MKLYPKIDSSQLENIHFETGMERVKSKRLHTSKTTKTIPNPHASRQVAAWYPPPVGGEADTSPPGAGWSPPSVVTGG